jgi:hypothetical protein
LHGDRFTTLHVIRVQIDRDARAVASTTTLGPTPTSATSAMVRAGDVICTPKRLATSSRRNGAVVV